MKERKKEENCGETGDAKEEEETRRRRWWWRIQFNSFLLCQFIFRLLTHSFRFRVFSRSILHFFSLFIHFRELIDATYSRCLRFASMSVRVKWNFPLSSFFFFILCIKVDCEMSFPLIIMNKKHEKKRTRNEGRCMQT